MSKIAAIAGSSIIGNILCGIAAFYTMAGYYGWNSPSQAGGTAKTAQN